MPIAQASAIPLREKNGETEVCLITSIRKGKWGFPKGIIEPGDSAEETALKKSIEEAGLHGEILGGPVGEYRYQKWNDDLDVLVYAMHVTRMDATWDEQTMRDREWLSPKEAKKRLTKSLLKEFLCVAVERFEHS